MINTYFTDTNVGIAYTYYPDKYHPSVKEIIDNTQKTLIWSTFTKQEFEKKYDEINQCIDDFFQEIYLILVNKEVYSYDFFERSVLKSTSDIELDKHKKVKILELIWNNDKFNSSFPQSIFKFTDELLSCFKHEKDNFTDKMKLFDCGKDNYKNHIALLKKLKKIGVHKPDYIIVIDADVCSFSEDIIFLTCDGKLHSKIIGCDFLNIQDYQLIEHAN